LEKDYLKGQKMQKNYQISFYVPMDYCETVKEKMFKARAGTVGNLDEED